MSTNWEKYASATDTLQQVGRDQKSPDDYGVGVLKCGVIRSLVGFSVDHTPLDWNRAHTDVLGPLDLPPEDILALQSQIRPMCAIVLQAGPAAEEQPM